MTSSSNDHVENEGLRKVTGWLTLNAVSRRGLMTSYYNLK